MDEYGSSSAGASSHTSREQRNERPLPPFPPFAQQKDLPADPMDPDLYQQFVESGEASGNQQAVERQYELWRDSGFQGTPSTYSQNEPPLPPTPPDTLAGESRNRGNSTPQIQLNNVDAETLVNELHTPSGRARSVSSTVSSRSNSITTPRETPSSQSRYRRIPTPSTEVVVPRWQPDAEVTLCPICHTQFSFFVRKHHCRKCGRVVCNACSPHRITIPYQYIVQLPVEGEPEPPASSRTRPARDPARIGSSAEVASLGGGERVRLCNPCVPDPNIAPPQTDSRQSPLQSNRPGHGRSVSGVPSSYSSYQRSQTQPNRQITPISVRDALRNSPGRPGPGMSDNNLQPRGSSYSSREDPRAGFDSYEARSRSSTVSGTSRGQRHMGNNNSTPRDTMATTFAQRYTSMIPRQDPDLSRPLPPAPRSQPRPQIPEEDECWICHRELPSRTLPNFETIRAQHVESCLRSAMQPSSSSSSPPAAQNTPSRPTASTNTAASTPTTNSTVGSPSPAQSRRTGVFPYIATEKDCVDDAECTICLEEFEVGVEMGRLECFCRFHLKCVRDWFGNKPGQCPVHQHGGGY